MFIRLHRCVLPGCLLITLLLGACAGLGLEEPQPEPETLRVLLRPFLSFAPFFVAEQEGYLAEQGLQIEFVEMSSSGAAIPALAHGELDVVAGTFEVGTLNAMGRGASIKIVADKGYITPTGCAYIALVGRRALAENGELDSPAQLQGRRIALEPATLEGYFVEKLLNTAGLALDDVETVDMPSPAELEALEMGTIDLTSTGEPWVTRILQSGHGVLWMPAQEVIPDFQWAFVAYGPSLLDDNPDAGRRFMVAYLKAVHQLNQGKTERNVELLADFTGLDVDLIEETCWPAFRQNGQINVQSVLDFQAWAVQKGYLDSPVTEEQFWDPSFVEYANEVLGAGSQ